jgi:hypothetical protein
MNPDIYSREYAAAGWEREKRELAAKQAQSRAAQPRRRDTTNGHRRRSAAP